MKYLKIWTSFLDIIEPLESAEIGRLFINMLTYAENGQEPAKMAGNERFIWPMAKQMIDLAAEKNEILRRNGQRGGRPKAKDNQEKPNETKENQTKPNDNQIKAYKEKERKGKEENEKISSSFLDDDEAIRIQGDHDRILNAADDAGFPKTNSVTAGLLSLYSDYGLEKILSGIQACVDHGAVNLAYLRAVLKGTPRQEKINPNSANNFTQRDYSGVDAELMAELEKDMDEYVRTGKARLERKKEIVPDQALIEQKKTEGISEKQKEKSCDNCRDGGSCIKRKIFEKCGGCQTFISK